VKEILEFSITDYQPTGIFHVIEKDSYRDFNTKIPSDLDTLKKISFTFKGLITNLVNQVQYVLKNSIFELILINFCSTCHTITSKA
jgi:hypothetical protein